MPLIQVDLDAELYASTGDAIGEAVHQAQIEALGIPADDRFQVFRPHAPGELKFDPGYNDVDRQNLLLIQVTAVHMYPVSVKRRFFETVVAKLAPLGVRPEDVQIALVENGFEDWYAGR
ncbi:tautomerase family protein [Gryllotalpicola protaetiae]|uniref:Tautomerase family protein n=1 Tax=Gryllotalpicola protaetiae TaxID=2419771 RepID=A0A387BNR4_9MICO|nr:tautomerase family protein [Gryllotalpicola protaetiae]AYG04092.1 tautomerase family protein [Gryllotalpicola protaetiae]